MISAELRAEKKSPVQPYDPVKQKFFKKHENTSERELLIEQLFENQFQTKILRKSKADINTIKWIVLISFIAAIVVGILIGIKTA